MPAGRRIANLLEDSQGMYAAWYATPSARIAINRLSHSGIWPYRAFDLGVTEADDPVMYDPRHSGGLEQGNTGIQEQGVLFQFQLPEGNTVLDECTLIAGMVVSSGNPNPTTGLIARYWSASTNPLVISDWTLAGSQALNLNTQLVTFTNPSVTTAKWLAFRIKADFDPGLDYVLRDVRQWVTFPRQPIEIEEQNGTQITDHYEFPTIFKGAIPASPTVRALRIRNTTGATKTVNIKRVMHHELEQETGGDVFQILSRLELSIVGDSSGFAAADVTAFSVPDGGANFWLRYKPLSTDESVPRGIGLGGLRLEVTA